MILLRLEHLPLLPFHLPQPCFLLHGVDQPFDKLAFRNDGLAADNRLTRQSSRIIVAVEIMLRISFWLVPAFSRVEPVSTSGPLSTSMAMSAWALTGASGLQAIDTVTAPTSRAWSSPPIT